MAGGYSSVEAFSSACADQFSYFQICEVRIESIGEDFLLRGAPLEVLYIEFNALECRVSAFCRYASFFGGGLRCAADFTLVFADVCMGYVTFFGVWFARCLGLLRGWDASNTDSAAFVFMTQDSLTAKPGVQLPLVSPTLFGGARTLSSGHVWRPSKQQVSFFMHAVGTFSATPFLASLRKVALFARAAVASPARTWQQPIPPGAQVRGTSLTPLLSRAMDLSSAYVVVA